MLKPLSILALSFLLTAGSSAPILPPIDQKAGLIFSKKLTYNRILDTATYTGNVRINFEDYYIMCDKFVIESYQKDGKLHVTALDFPQKTKILKKDMSEVVILPKATYETKNFLLKSDGKIYLEKDGKHFTTDSLEVKMGPPKKVDFLKW